MAHKGFVAFEVETVGTCGSRLATRPRDRRDRRDGRRCSRGIATLDARLRSGAEASAARDGLRPRVGDRGRAGVLELSGALPAQGGASYDPGRDGRGRRAELEALAGGTGATVRRAVPSRSVRGGDRRAGGRSPPQASRPRRTSAGSRSGPTRRSSRTPGFRPSSSGRSSAAFTAPTSGSTSPRSSAVTMRTSPSRGSCAREAAGRSRGRRALGTELGRADRRGSRLPPRRSRRCGRAGTGLGGAGPAACRPFATSGWRFARRGADVVVLASPPSTHRPLAELALARGLSRDRGEAARADVPRRRGHRRGGTPVAGSPRDGVAELPLSAAVARASRSRSRSRARPTPRNPHLVQARSA